MAYRITIQGATIEADTAADVQALLLAFRERVPALLPAGPSARQENAGRAAPQKRGGVTRRASDVAARVAEAIAAGVSTPAAIRAYANVPAFACRVALRALVAEGVIAAEGATSTRRYYLVVRGRTKPAAPAKEAVRR